MTKLPQEKIDALATPLPPEAIAPHPTKTYLSTIKAIYVVERLNQVFGIGGWFQRNEVVEISSEVVAGDGKRYPNKMKVVHSFFEVPEYGIKLDNFGGNDNVDEGDAFKGAATDALTKMASFLGVGMDVYKGKATQSTQSPQNAPQTLHKPPQSMQTSQLGEIACEHGTPAKRLQVKKVGPNTGRYFYACPNPKADQCDYFQWEDELDKHDKVFSETMRKAQQDEGFDDFSPEEEEINKSLRAEQEASNYDSMVLSDPTQSESR